MVNNIYGAEKIFIVSRCQLEWCDKISSFLSLTITNSAAHQLINLEYKRITETEAARLDWRCDAKFFRSALFLLTLRLLLLWLVNCSSTFIILLLLR